LSGAVTIRPARASERRSLIALQRRAALANPGDRAALQAHPDAIDLPARQIADGHVWVAERDGHVVGFHVTLPRDDGGADLDGLFVEPEKWRSGIGRALVEHAAERARQSGAAALHVLGNPHAEGFYSALGFQTGATAATRFGPGLIMRLPLPRPSA
jgi:predicted N-acetyltransferase YhbS